MRSRNFGINNYTSLKEKAGRLKWVNESRLEHFCLFGKSGFTEAMIRQAGAEGVVLFTKDKIKTQPSFS